MISDSELKSLLENHKPAGSNHYVAKCPFCNKDKHFYINRKTGNFDCKSCQEAGSLQKLFFHLGKTFVTIKKTVELGIQIPLMDIGLMTSKEETKELLPCKPRKLPIGFKRIYQNDYLKGRHFTELDFEMFNIGTTKLKDKYKDYIIFSIDEDNISRGFIGRCFRDKDYVVENNLKRYENSPGTKFGELLFGYDLITTNTTTVILVEGLFDVIRLNNLLGLYFDESIKCLATFGKKISPSQIQKLKIKGIKNIVLLYDPDAIRETKKYAATLSEEFTTVQVGYFFNGKDSSDSTDEEIFQVLENLETVQGFHYSKVPKIR